MLETCDGFDTYNTSQVNRRYPGGVTGGLGDFSVVAPGANGSGQCVHFGFYYGSPQFTFPLTPRTSYIIGFNFKVSTLGSQILAINTSAGQLCSIGSNSLGAITTTFGNSSTAGAIVASTWLAVQVKLVISTTVGALVVKIDGVTIINLANLNTGSNPILSIMLTGTNGTDTWFDDLWVFNLLGTHSNDFPLGKMNVQVQTPVSDGTHQDWTPSSGTDRFAMVNGIIADDDTTYVIGQSVSSVDTYGLSSVSGPINKVHGTVITAIYRKDDVDAKTLRVVGLSSGVLTESADISCPLSYTSSSLVLAEDPNTNAQWTETNINSLQIGVKVVA